MTANSCVLWKVAAQPYQRAWPVMVKNTWRPIHCVKALQQQWNVRAQMVQKIVRTDYIKWIECHLRRTRKFIYLYNLDECTVELLAAAVRIIFLQLYFVRRTVYIFLLKQHFPAMFELSCIHHFA